MSVRRVERKERIHATMKTFEIGVQGGLGSWRRATMWARS